MPTAPKLRHFVGGILIDGLTDDYHASLNPSEPSDIVAEGPLGSAKAVDEAVNAAEAAFTSWRGQVASVRGSLLYAWADTIQARLEEIAQAVCREVGKPITEARGETGRCVALLRYYAGEAVRPSGDVIPAGRPGALQYAVHAPVGVAGLITPWNFPVAIPIWKIAPALAFGNTVVLKPSELSPACAALLAETATAAGLPAGVLNIVYGAGVTGAALAGHAGISLISFTGSGIAGQKVAEACAARNVKYQTEMGGKNVGIVLEDANIAKAATLVAGGAMRYAGQKCTATSRVVVDNLVMDEFLDALKTAVKALPLGPVTDPVAAIGPVISETSREKVTGAISNAKGHVLAGGAIVPGGPGYFIHPTIIAGVDKDSELAQTELFGPVLAVLEANGLDHALATANDVKYGLSASLYTRDLANALAYAEKIDVGLVRVNGDTTGVDPHAPFGGVKASGSHSREQGQAARDFYTEIKTVELNP